MKFLEILCLGMGLILAGLVTAALADERKVPQPIQEVFQSDLLYPQEEEEVQLTLLPTFRDRSSGRSQFQTEMEIEYGFTDAWQLQVEWDGVVHHMNPSAPDITGPGDFSVGTQYSFMALQDGNTHLALGTNLGFPVGDVDRGLSDGFLEVETYWTVARDFPQWNQAQVFSQMGVEWVSRVSNPAGSPRPPAAHTFFWNVGGFLPLGSLIPTLEFNWENNEWNHGGQTNTLYATPGVIWKISKEWEMGVGVPVGLTADSDDVRVVGLLLYEFEWE